MSPGPLRCREVVELVTAYLDGALAPADGRRVQEHLGLCDPCVRFVAQLRETTRAVSALELPAPPDPAAPLAAFRGCTGAGGA